MCWHQRPVLMAITEEKVTISALVPAMVTVCMEMLEYDEDYDMELVGDFTTLTLLEVCQQKGGNFADRAKAIQQRLVEFEHILLSSQILHSGSLGALGINGKRCIQYSLSISYFLLSLVSRTLFAHFK